jgi:hypothetical protein
MLASDTRLARSPRLIPPAQDRPSRVPNKGYNYAQKTTARRTFAIYDFSYAITKSHLSCFY